MKKVNLNQMYQLSGGGCVADGAGCVFAVAGIALLFTNPVTGTAAAMGGAFVSGFGAGLSCASLAACIYDSTH